VIEPITHIAGSPSHYPGGVTLFRQDDLAGTLYFIETGVVRLSRQQSGRQFLIGLCGEGSLVGTSAAILGRAHPSTATTFGDCILQPLPAAALSATCLADPAFSAWIHRMQARESLDHLATLGVFGLSHPRPRLEQLLARMVCVGGRRNADGSVTLTARLTHEEYAEAIGTSREYVTRLLAELCREGVVQRSKGWLVVPKGSPLLRSAG
jgi:CRP/FNR family transcriptional regulator